MHAFAVEKSQEQDSPNLPSTRQEASADWSQSPSILNARRAATFNASEDIHEQEAERVAHQVLHASGPQFRPTCPCAGRCPRCVEDSPLRAPAHLSQMPATESLGATAAMPPIVSEVIASSGKPLDSRTRAFMEPRFGYDFSAVRIHSDSSAAESAEGLNALAYTVGRDVIFRAGSYQPETSQGQRLLAHELSHVVQQKGARPLGGLAVNRAALSTSGPRIQRQEMEPWQGVVNTEEDPLMMRATPEVTSPSHLNAVGKLAKGASVTVLSGSKFGWMKVRGTTTEGDEKTGFVRGKYIEPGASTKPSTPASGGTPAAPATPPISVDKIDVVTSSAGAEKGFIKGVGNSDPNNPGPFNTPPSPLSPDWPFSGECTNVHQIHFHLDNGKSAKVLPMRQVKATWSYGGASGFESQMPEDKEPPPGSSKATVPGGFAGTRSADDGPPAHEILRPTTDKIAISDTPGVKSGLGTWLSPYPFKMDMDFVLTIWAKAGYPIARVTFSVFIEKRDEKEVPNQRNEVVVKQKQDLVRDVVLP